jgi:hypothetical protein
LSVFFFLITLLSIFSSGIDDVILSPFLFNYMHSEGAKKGTIGGPIDFHDFYAHQKAAWVGQVRLIWEMILYPRFASLR